MLCRLCKQILLKAPYIVILSNCLLMVYCLPQSYDKL